MNWFFFPIVPESQNGAVYRKGLRSAPAAQDRMGGLPEPHPHPAGLTAARNVVAGTLPRRPPPPDPVLVLTTWSPVFADCLFSPLLDTSAPSVGLLLWLSSQGQEPAIKTGAGAGA